MRELTLSRGEYARYLTGSMHRPDVWAAIDETAALSQEGRFCRIEVADALAVRFQQLVVPEYARAVTSVQAILRRELPAMTNMWMIAEIGHSTVNGSMEYRTLESPAWDLARTAISVLKMAFPEEND